MCSEHKYTLFIETKIKKQKCIVVLDTILVFMVETVIKHPTASQRVRKGGIPYIRT
jgi:hypothetical protein